MSTDLNTLIHQALTTHQEQEAEQRRQAEAQKRAKEQEAEQKMRQLLSEFLPDLLPGIDLTFGFISGGHQAWFSYLGYDWHIYQERSSGWSVYIARVGTHNTSRHIMSSVRGDVLQAKLLVELGQHQERVLRDKAAREKDERDVELRQKEYKEEQFQKELAQKQRLEDANAEHERLSAILAELRDEAEKSLWQWPEGVTIEVYYLEYCKGSYRDEDSDTHFDYDGDWTATSTLDSRGRIQIEHVQHSKSPKSAQVIQLMPEVHKPRWTVYTYSSINDLPEVLYQEVTVSLPNVVQRLDRDWLDMEMRLVETDTLRWDESPYQETVGKVPLPWIRDLVEQAQKQENL